MFDPLRSSCAVNSRSESLMLFTVAGVTTFLGLLSPLLTISRGMPQALRIYRAGTEGISVGTWLLNIVVSELWLAYGIVFHVPAEIVAHVPNIILAAIVVNAVSRQRGTFAKDVKIIFGITVAVLVLASVSQTDAHYVLSFPAMLASIVFFLPQMTKALRERDLLGVSITTWLFAFLAAASWAAYGLLIHQVAIAIPSAVMIPASTIIMIRVLVQRRAIDVATI